MNKTLILKEFKKFFVMGIPNNLKKHFQMKVILSNNLIQLIILLTLMNVLR